ncbi:MAG: RIP metalloprotease RseP [Clostridia bacterium]|nr:RIP metalloprotease RseP [Clostridia bacterium]
MINFFITIIKVIFLLGFLIFIHEGGHFLVAKLCKVKVNEFALGFGPTIWKSKKTETKYALRLIPLGGFVSMEGEEERSDNEGSFSKTSIPKRIAIIVAGGAVNILFAVIIYFGLVLITGNYASQKIELVSEQYNAINSGIVKGDEITKINGKKIRNKKDIDEIMSKSQGEEVDVEVKRNNEKINVKVKPTTIPSKDTGIYLGTQGDELTTKIVSIYPKSPAEEKGIKTNDVIKKINGQDVNNDPYKVVEYISNTNEENIIFTLERKGELIDIEVKPNILYTYILGVQFEKAENNFINNVYYGFWDTIDFCASIIDNLKMLFSGSVSTQQLIGPIGISGVVANTKGVSDFIYILALVSLSLGVTNLLPFPPLDGGKVVIYLIEAIRKKPLPEKVEINIQLLGFALLIGLTIYVTYNDILRMI